MLISLSVSLFILPGKINIKKGSFTMIEEIIKAFSLIFIAEMGDKTQILAMAFATRYPVGKVLLGIFLGCLLNHGMAVALGSYISNFIPVNIIQIIAGFAFVGFALWTLKSEDAEDEEEEKKTKFGPVLTVALAFFIGELGDKTQLTVITLATDAVYPLAILCGAVLGMIVTGGMGIFVGKKIGDKIPEFTIKLVAASIFMFFGISKLYQNAPAQYLSIPYITAFIGILAAIVFVMVNTLIKKRKQGIESAFIKQSKELYNYYHQIMGDMDNICLGLNNCVNCMGDKCIVGYTKCIVRNKLNANEKSNQEDFVSNELAMEKVFEEEKVIQSLICTLKILKKDPKNNEYADVHRIRRQLEMILLKKSIENMNNWDEYMNDLKNINVEVAEKIANKI